MYFTLLVSRSEYPRDKPFLLTMVSYLKKYLNSIQYLLGVLCRQQIKPFQVVSTSEFHAAAPPAQRARPSQVRPL